MLLAVAVGRDRPSREKSSDISPHPGLCSPREGSTGMRRAGRRQCRDIMTDIQRHDGGARSDRVTHTLSAHGTWSRACTRRLCLVPLPRACCHHAARRPRERLRDRRIPHPACDVARAAAVGQLCFEFSTKKKCFFQRLPRHYPGEECSDWSGENLIFIAKVSLGWGALAWGF